MRPAAVDAEAQREVLQLAAVPRQRAHERQRVVEHQAVDAVPPGREPAQHGNVEPLAVVRDEHVVAYKGAELRPNGAERRGGLHLGIGVAMHLAGAGRDRPERIDQRVEAIDDLAPHDARRADLHDPAQLDIRVRRLQVERDVPLERGVELLGMDQLERLEQGEREPLGAAVPRA